MLAKPSLQYIYFSYRMTSKLLQRAIICIDIFYTHSLKPQPNINHIRFHNENKQQEKGPLSRKEPTYLLSENKKVVYHATRC